jgi:hypothetical protein
MTATFDVAGARNAGYSDAEIADHLAGDGKFNIAQARKAGYSDSEIIDHLAPGPNAPKPLNASGTAAIADHAARADAFAKAAADERAKRPGAIGTALGVAGNFAKGVADTALNLGSQVIAMPVAGLAGISQGIQNAYDEAAGNPVGMSAADRVAKISNALTYQPRSDVGKEAQANIAAPVQWLGDKADRAGQVATDVTGSPAVGAAVNTAIQAAPALILRKGGPLSRVTIGTAPQAAAAAAPGTAAAAAEAAIRAKAYVTGTAGLDWDALSDSLKAKLTTIAQSAGQLDKLDPLALAREAKLQALPVPVPATAAQLTRDPVALRNEGNVSATAAGAPIRDVHLAANQALLDNLDVLKGKVSGSGDTAATATTPEEVGASVQGAARGKLLLQQAKVKAAYAAADNAGETLQKVDTTPILDMIEKTPDQSHYGYAKQWMKGNTDGEGSGTSIRDLEDLRKAAVAKAMNGGEDGYYAGKLINAIDAATDGAGGKLYAAARALRKAQGTEFEEQAPVADLVSDSSRTDRTTALSNTVKAITSGAPEDIRTIKRTLLTGGDTDTRTAGRQAWRDVRAQVIQRIKDDASSSVAPNADGSPNLTAIGLQRAIAKYGPQKLDEIFGPGTTRQINAIMDAAKTVKTSPPTAAVGSSTFANVLAFLEKGLTKVPVVGGPVADIVRGVVQLKNLGAAGREAQAATVTPLNQALAKVNGKATRADLARQAAGASKIIPLSALGQQNR